MCSCVAGMRTTFSPSLHNDTDLAVAVAIRHDPVRSDTAYVSKRTITINHVEHGCVQHQKVSSFTRLDCCDSELAEVRGAAPSLACAT
jgi:hypothetical protein